MMVKNLPIAGLNPVKSSIPIAETNWIFTRSCANVTRFFSPLIILVFWHHQDFIKAIRLNFFCDWSGANCCQKSFVLDNNHNSWLMTHLLHHQKVYGFLKMVLNSFNMNHKIYTLFWANNNIFFFDFEI